MPRAMAIMQPRERIIRVVSGGSATEVVAVRSVREVAEAWR